MKSVTNLISYLQESGRARAGLKAVPTGRCPKTPRVADAALASPHVRPSRPCRLSCPCRADSRPTPRRLGRLTAVPTVSPQSCRRLRSVSRAAALSDVNRASAPPPWFEASPGAKPLRCPRPPPCPCPDSRVRRFLPAPPTGLSVLAVQPRCRRVPSLPKVPLPLSVPECATAVGAVRLGRPCRQAVPSPWARVCRAPWALSPA
jgi:hypothetical protein